MSIAAGVRFGPYEIVAPLGSGGMGEVYKANDTRLDRIVAIKVLPPQLADDPQFRERFEREAKAISKLTHPHICTLFDVGETTVAGHEPRAASQARFLVMEFLEGETLAARLERSALPLDETLRRAIEIASALDAAHRAGIVHRDLKPGNVMLTKAGAKLLDFGLAKSGVPTAARSQIGGSIMPTEDRALTAQGTILGTFQYMAPEQIEGEQVDARTDLFAFGAVLYEMLTGRRPFQGKSQPSLLGAILKEDPPPASQLQPLVPSALDHVVRTCLAKNPDDRFQTAHDLLLQLRWIVEGGSAVGAPAVVVAHRKRRDRVMSVALAVAVLLWLATLVPAGLYFRRAADDREIQFIVTTPDMPNAYQVTVSPDGRLLAFVASPSSGARTVLWLRPLNATVAQPLPGTEGAGNPFWSPDSRHIGFGADGKLKKVDVTGGPPQTLSEVRGFARGAWNRDDVIVYSDGTVLNRVSAAGGATVAITQLDKSQQETNHLWPYFLPDGRHVLYSTWSQQQDKRAIFVGSLDSPQRTHLLTAESMAAYAMPGFLIFQRGGTLFAQSFDAKRVRLTGDPVRIAEDVANNAGNGRAGFAVSDTGVLVYRTGQSIGATKVLSWFDRNGKALGLVGEPWPYFEIRLSPDDKRVAVNRLDAKANTQDIWTLDLSSNIQTRLTFDPANDVDPVWSPDGRSIAFSSNRKGKLDLFQQTVGSSSETVLFESTDDGKYLDDWSSDGRFLLYHQASTLYALPLAGDRKPIVLDRSPFAKDEAHFSPDGRWIAFQSDQSGSVECHVASFPAFEDRRQVSAHGGSEPRWRSDGKELFYLAADGKLMSVDVKVGPSLEFGIPKTLFQTPLSAGFTRGVDNYGVSRNGQRFLFMSPQRDSSASIPINVVVNWTAGLKF